jgi:hypothetical protein
MAAKENAGNAFSLNSQGVQLDSRTIKQENPSSEPSVYGVRHDCGGGLS